MAYKTITITKKRVLSNCVGERARGMVRVRAKSNKLIEDYTFNVELVGCNYFHVNLFKLSNTYGADDDHDGGYDYVVVGDDDDTENDDYDNGDYVDAEADYVDNVYG
ncbi:hypothetical protein DPMN_020373 [Dreissena polymorpha]|uniref:Uncharacterized protein n=1 Tax=Dreissena polymorpha TaxID=45954 RepID=A0A9D4NKY2_DREPO|nr:hypothetical protein DPMN_020373 [Dreissena polymorpha]